MTRGARFFRTGAMAPRLDEQLVDRLRASSTATLGHLTDLGFVRGLTAIAPIRSSFVGSALTVRIPHADSTAVHHALGLAQPGDVLVIDQSGDDGRSSFGGTLAGIAADAGVVAAISNGRTNDVDEIAELGFPLFSRGATPLTTRLHGFEGRINDPVSVGGVAVLPGDVVFGDADGVCVIPRTDAQRILQTLEELDADPVILGLRDAVRAGTPLGSITGASALYEANHG